jgi:sortase A
VLSRRFPLGLAVVIVGFVLLAFAAARAVQTSAAPVAPATATPPATLPATSQPMLTAAPTLQSAAASPTPAATHAAARPTVVGRANSVPMDEPLDPVATPLPAAPPRLLIPSLEVDEPILTIPIKDGAWDLSELNLEIGWLSSTGREPGDSLAMAFIGHFTVAGARPGPLADIWDTRPGDEIIYRANGTDFVYAIEDRKTVGPQAIKELYVPDGDRLLLVTCTNWDFLNWEYSDRLIVQAALVRESPSP